MNVSLTAELTQFINKKVKEGLYENASEVVREALRQLKQGDRAADGSATLTGDIEAMAFVVMMQATRDMEQDLKMIMAEVKAITAAKQKLRDLIAKVNRDVGANVGQAPSRPSQPLDFSTGMGSEGAYHQAQIPVADPESKNGVRFVPTDLYNGHLEHVAQLRSVQDDLKGQLDSMNEMSEMTSLRLQMMMDRRSKFISTLSNIMKKISATSESLVQNLK